MEHNNKTTPTSNTRPHSRRPTLSLLSWNCAGIKNKIALLSNTLKRDNIQIALLQETWSIPPPNIKGYITYHIPATKKNTRGRPSKGTTTLVRDTILSRKVPSPKTNPEADTLLVRITLADSTIDIYNIYNPPGNTYTLTHILSQLGTKAEHQIIAGDFNTKHSAWGKNNSDTPRGSRLLAEILNSATHSIMNDGSNTFRGLSAIDLCIVDSTLAATATWDQNHLYSDHHATVLHTNAGTITPLPPAPRFNLDQADWGAFNQHLEKRIKEDPPRNCDQFTNLAHQAMKACIPTTTTPTHTGSTTSPAVRRAKRFSNKLLRKLRLNPNRGTENLVKITTNWATETELKEKDRKWRLWCTKINWHTTATKLWKKLNSLQGRITQTPALPHPLETAVELTTTFINRTNPALSLPPTHIKALATLEASRREKIEAGLATPSAADLDSPLTRGELDRALNQAKKKRTAPGSDGVPTFTWSKLSNANRASLLPLLNDVHNTATIPQSWKDADIIPIPKKGTNEHRPISLLQTIGKVSERIILNRLETLAENPASGLPEELSGFRRDRGTQNATAALMETIRYNKGLGYEASIIFLDLEKAFELVDHNVVLSSLVELGITGKPLAYVQDYLTDRRARVRLQGAKSPYQKLKNGVPQGAVLSPLLFNAVMATLTNNINGALRKGRIKRVLSFGFADDMAFACFTRGGIQGHTDEVLQIVGTACMNLGLKVSAGKTKAMLMFKPPPTRPLKLNGKDIEWVPSFRYLGTIIHHKLFMRPLIEDLTKRMRARLLIMNRISGFAWGAPSTVLSLFYRQAVRALYDFASPALATAEIISKTPRYGLHRESYLEKGLTSLETIQYQAARLINRAPRSTRTEILLLEAGLPPLRLRGRQLLANFHTRFVSLGGSDLSSREATFTLNFTAKGSLLSKGLQTVLRKLKGEHGMGVSEVYKPHHRPPWFTVPVELRLTKLNGAKTDYPAPLLKALAGEEISQAQSDHPLNVIVYTDGSLNPETGRAGAGMVIPSREVKDRIRVSDFASTLDTETAAIIMALAAVPNESCTIVTDSRNAMLNIAAPKGTHIGASIAQDNLQERHEAGLKTLLLWVPSHIGLRGNDLADAAAAEGALLNEVGCLVSPSISKRKADAARRSNKLWEDSLSPERIKNPYSPSWIWYSLVRKHIPRPTGLPASTHEAVSRFRLGYRRWADVPNYKNCPCGKKLFSVAHILATCEAMDRTDLGRFMDDPSLQKNDDQSTALAILHKMAKTSWDPLARFYRRNKATIETVGEEDGPPS
jgi:ribonuclease HI/exonuclease III